MRRFTAQWQQRAGQPFRCHGYVRGIRPCFDLSREVRCNPDLDQGQPGFESALCEKLVAAGGHIANIGVHGEKVDLHLENLWDRNISITTRLVDTATIPMLFKTVLSKKVDPTLLISHHFKLDKILEAYETFGNAAKTKALKVIIAP